MTWSLASCRGCHSLARRAVRNVCFIISASYQCRLPVPAGVYATTRSAFTHGPPWFTLCTVWATILISRHRLLHHLLRFYHLVLYRCYISRTTWLLRTSHMATECNRSRRRRAGESPEQTARRQAAGREYVRLRHHSRRATDNFEAA